jgi:hypothetical protein
MMPPAIVDVLVVPKGRKRVHIWVPMFLLWPLLLVLAILGLVLTIVVDSVLLVSFRRYHDYTRLLLGCLGLFADCRGLSLDIDNRETTVRLTVA